MRPAATACDRVSHVDACCQRIGHGGASALAPGNTLPSFDAALEVGIDMVEFDVRPWRGELVLAHTLLHASAGRSVRLPDALAHLASRRFRDVGLNVDVKHGLVDSRLLEAVEDRSGLLYAWTVNDRGSIQSLRGLGVHGIATADPRLFAPPELAASPEFRAGGCATDTEGGYSAHETNRSRCW